MKIYLGSPAGARNPQQPHRNRSTPTRRGRGTAARPHRRAVSWPWTVRTVAAGGNAGGPS